MPEIDGFVFVAPHPGQGMLLMGCIDPSVSDERDPLSVDSSLDPLDASNGFAEPPHRPNTRKTFWNAIVRGSGRVARVDAAALDSYSARFRPRERKHKAAETRACDGSASAPRS